MIIIFPTIKYGSTFYNTFTMGVWSNYHGYFFLCATTFPVTGASCHTPFNCMKNDIQTRLNKNISFL